MSHFYATIKGHRGEANRCGNKNSGIVGHIRGWNVGARVEVHTETYLNIYGQKEERDVVRVFKTKGSSGGPEKMITEFYK